MPHCDETGSVVTTYTPGVVTGRYTFGAVAPSFARSATISVATFSPTAIPSVLAAPSAMRPIDLL